MQTSEMPAFQFAYRNDFDTFLKVMRVYRLSPMRAVVTTFVWALIGMLISFITASSQIAIKDYIEAMTGRSGIVIVAALFFLPVTIGIYLRFVRIPLLFRRMSTANQEITVSLSDSGVREEYSGTSTTIPWAGIAGIREHGDLLLLVRAPLEMIPIPGHATATIGDRAMLVDYVKARIHGPAGA